MKINDKAISVFRWLFNQEDASSGFGDYLDHPGCCGPLIDGSHDCFVCQHKASQIIAAAEALGETIVAAAWKATLREWTGEDDYTC